MPIGLVGNNSIRTVETGYNFRAWLSISKFEAGDTDKDLGDGDDSELGD